MDAAEMTIVQIHGDATPFNRSLDQAERRFNSFTRNVSGWTGGGGGLGANPFPRNYPTYGGGMGGGGQFGAFGGIGFGGGGTYRMPGGGGGSGGRFGGLAGSLAIGAGFATAHMAINAVESGLSSVVDLLYAGGKAAIELGAEFEAARISMEVMTGSAEKGQKAFKDIVDLAIRTPFTTQGLLRPAQTLLGYGTVAEDLIPTLSRLGDIAQGDETKLMRLALAFGQVRAAGRFMGEERRQFANLGVGMEDFARTMGVSTREFRDLMAAGKVGPEVMIATINRLTSEGGRFAGMSQRHMQTVKGAWSNLVETLQQTGAGGAESFFRRFGVGIEVNNLADAIRNLSQQKIDVWFRDAADATQPFITGLKVAGQISVETAGSIFGRQGNWKDMKGDIRDFAITFTSVFKDVADVIEIATIKMAIFSQTMSSFMKTPLGQVFLSTLAPGLQALFRLPNNVLFGGLNAAGNPEQQARLAQLQGRVGNQRADVEGRFAVQDIKDAGNILLKAMRPMFLGVPQIPIPMDISQDAIQEATKLKKALETAGTPLEQFARHIGNLEEGFRGGRPGMGGLLGPGADKAVLNEQQFRSGLFMAYEHLQKGLGTTMESKLPSMAMEGSQAAQDTINRSNQMIIGVQERIHATLIAAKTLQEQQATYEREAKDYLQQLVERGENILIPVPKR